MLLLGLTVFAMARPLIHEDSTTVGTSSFQDLVLVIDNSYFAAAEFEKEPLIDHIRRDAASLLNAADGTAVVLTCGSKDEANSSFSSIRHPRK